MTASGDLAAELAAVRDENRRLKNLLVSERVDELKDENDRLRVELGRVRALLQPVTERQLARIMTVCDAASPEPWSTDQEGNFHRLPGRTIAHETSFSDADRQFIVFARSELPRLVEQIAKLRAELERAYMQRGLTDAEISEEVGESKADLAREHER